MKFCAAPGCNQPARKTSEYCSRKCYSLVYYKLHPEIKERENAERKLKRRKPGGWAENKPAAVPVPRWVARILACRANDGTHRIVRQITPPKTKRRKNKLLDV